MTLRASLRCRCGHTEWGHNRRPGARVRLRAGLFPCVRRGCTCERWEVWEAAPLLPDPCGRCRHTSRSHNIRPKRHPHRPGYGRHPCAQRGCRCQGWVRRQPDIPLPADGPRPDDAERDRAYALESARVEEARFLALLRENGWGREGIEVKLALYRGAREEAAL